MRPQVIIGVPVYRYLEPEALLSIAGPCLRYNQWIRDVKVPLDTYLEDARNHICELACDDPVATHLWFIDADMDIPQDALPKLLRHSVEVVGGWYCSRDGQTAAWSIEDYQDGLRCKPIQECPEEFQRVGGVAPGCMLVQVDVLRRMRDRYGEDCWFRKEGRWIREDMFFSFRLRDMGIPSYLDNTIQCGHMAKMLLTRELWEHRQRKHAAMDAAING
jgi:hypothetical protein